VLFGTALLFLQVAVAAVRLRRISLCKTRHHGRRDSILVMVVTSPAPLLIPAHTDNNGA
jgi:hypothetical protein